MTDLWISILNMSITASYVAVAVILARVLLRRAPKIFSYMLWSAVMIRLILPVSFTSSFSILRLAGPAGSSGTGQLQFVPKNIGRQAQPALDTGTGSAGSLWNSLLPPVAPSASVNPVQVILWKLRQYDLADRCYSTAPVQRVLLCESHAQCPYSNNCEGACL